MIFANILLELDEKLNNLQASIGDENLFFIKEDRQILIDTLHKYEEEKERKIKGIDELYILKIEKIKEEIYFWLKEAEEELKSQLTVVS